MSGIEQVIANGKCIGCGGRGVATDGRIPIRLTTRGLYEADISGTSEADRALGSAVCPFADESLNEDAIADEVFEETMPKDPRTGRYLANYAGRVLDDTSIPGSSSGGLTSWMLTELLRLGKVDGVIHVGSTETPMFGYIVSRSVEEVLDNRKSKYHPASFAKTLQSIRGDGQKYAFVGVPCAVRSARLLTREDEALREQLAFYVGIVCGHMKSTAYAESFAWQVGVPPEDVETVDFRIKNPELTSRQYGFGAKDRGSGKWHEEQTLSLVGGSWGHAVFQPDACNFCDDIFAETADVVFGDAWMPKYEIDWRGTNVIVARNLELNEILKAGAADKKIMLDVIDVDAAASTQGGNFRHRHEGLAVRLADDQAAGRWSPRKRIQPSYEGVTSERISLIRQRRDLSERSHEFFLEAKKAGDLQVYLKSIRPLIQSYQQLTKMTFRVRVQNKLQREFWKIARRLSRK